MRLESRKLVLKVEAISAKPRMHAVDNITTRRKTQSGFHQTTMLHETESNLQTPRLDDEARRWYHKRHSDPRDRNLEELTKQVTFQNG